MKSWRFRRAQSVPDVYSRVVNVVFLGAAGVGKSSLVRRLLDREFMEDYVPTVYDVFHKEIINDNGRVNFQITDMSGYYSFPPMRRIAISKSNVFVLVYEIGNSKSYEEVKRLKDEIIELKGDCGAGIIIVGNKTDVKTHAKKLDVEKEDDLIASSFTTLKISAKTGESVFQLLQSILDLSNKQISVNVRRRQFSQNKASRSLKAISIKW